MEFALRGQLEGSEVGLYLELLELGEKLKRERRTPWEKRRGRWQEMSYKIRLLKAEHGDAIIVDIPGDDGLHHIVIDGGPSSKFTCDEIVNNIDFLGTIDLMVLTHFDDDHIGGLLAYFEKHKNGVIPIKNCWVNCASQAQIYAGALISYNQAHSLENLLKKSSQRQTLEWKDHIVNTMEPINMGFCKIQVLSPSPEALSINVGEYAKKDSVAIVSANSIRAKIDEGIALSELAKRPDIKHSTKEDIVNKSSIAFILEEGNTKVLFMGDADPWIVMDKLKSMGYTKDTPLYLNYWKLSHHGSRNNLCNELLGIIRCSNFIVSTNGGSGRSYHPDRETLAKILCHPDRIKNDTTRFYFNYPLKEIQERTGLLLTEVEKYQYHCEMHNENELVVS